MADLTEWEQDSIRNLRAEKTTSLQAEKYPWAGTHRLNVFDTVPVQVQILNELAVVPVAAKAGDAGFDLRSMVDVKLSLGLRRLIPTGLAVAIPDGFAGFVLPRSGLAITEGLGVVNSPGLVDSGYRGEIKVALINLGFEEIRIKAGDRIAQLVILPVPSVEFQVVDALPESERGEGGFGSTGA